MSLVLKVVGYLCMDSFCYIHTYTKYYFIKTKCKNLSTNLDEFVTGYFYQINKLQKMTVFSHERCCHCKSIFIREEEKLTTDKYVFQIEILRRGGGM